MGQIVISRKCQCIRVGHLFIQIQLHSHHYNFTFASLMNAKNQTFWPEIQFKCKDCSTLALIQIYHFAFAMFDPVSMNPGQSWRFVFVNVTSRVVYPFPFLQLFHNRACALVTVCTESYICYTQIFTLLHVPICKCFPLAVGLFMRISYAPSSSYHHIPVTMRRVVLHGFVMRMQFLTLNDHHKYVLIV